MSVYDPERVSQELEFVLVDDVDSTGVAINQGVLRQAIYVIMELQAEKATMHQNMLTMVAASTGIKAQLVELEAELQAYRDIRKATRGVYYSDFKMENWNHVLHIEGMENES